MRGLFDGMRDHGDPQARLTKIGIDPKQLCERMELFGGEQSLTEQTAPAVPASPAAPTASIAPAPLSRVEARQVVRARKSSIMEEIDAEAAKAGRLSESKAPADPVAAAKTDVQEACKLTADIARLMATRYADLDEEQIVEALETVATEVEGLPAAQLAEDALDDKLAAYVQTVTNAVEVYELGFPEA